MKMKIDKRKNLSNVIKDNGLQKETKNVGLIKIKKSKLRRLKSKQDTPQELITKLENEIKQLEEK